MASNTETASRSAESNTWNIALDVPTDTDFTVDITWCDTMDIARVDLTRLSETVTAITDSGQMTLVFDFSEFDYDGFNLNNDEYTNLEGRNNGTSPFIADEVIEDSTTFRYEEDQEHVFNQVERQDGPLVVEARWTSLADAPENNEAWKNQPGFNQLLAASTLLDACTSSENCELSFDQMSPVSQTQNSIGFSITVPPLKASAGLAYELEEIHNTQESTLTRFLFCLVAINEPPIAVDDSFTVTAGVPLIISASQGVNLLSNDTDDTDVSNFVPLLIDTTPARAPELATTFSLQSDGGFTYSYDVDPDVTGILASSDSFEYPVCDGTSSSTAIVSLEIAQRDLPPVQIAEIPVQMIVVGIANSSDLSTYFKDPENSELSFSALSEALPPSGNLMVTDVGILSGTTQLGDEGSYSIEIAVQDQESSVSGILTLEVQANQRPVTRPIADIGPFESGEAISVNVAQNFSDPEGAALSFSLDSTPASGLQINSTTGLITGQIANAGVYTQVVSAMDGITEAVSSSFTITQLPAPTAIMTIAPESLILNALINENDTKRISVGNDGTASLGFTVTSNQTWLAVSSSNGTLAPGENRELLATAQCSQSTTTRSGILSFGGNGGSQAVPVSTNCTEAQVPILVVVPVTVSLTAETNDANNALISISNDGNALLQYNITSDQTWLTTNSNGGTLAPGEAVSVEIKGLCGTQVAILAGTLSINDGDKRVAVTLNCRGPVLSNISPLSFDLTANFLEPAQARLSFSNTGNEPLYFTVKSDSDWLCPDELGHTDCTGGDAVTNQLLPLATYNLPIVANCLDDVSYSLTGTLTIEGNFETTLIPVELACIVVPESIYSDLQLNTPSVGSVDLGDSAFYRVSGANYVHLKSSSGNTGISVFSDESRNNLLCQSSTGRTGIGNCVLPGDTTYFVQISGFSDANYSLIGAFAEPVESDSTSTAIVSDGDSNFYLVDDAVYITLTSFEGGNANLYVYAAAAVSLTEYSQSVVLVCEHANVVQDSENCSGLNNSTTYYVQVSGNRDTQYQLITYSYVIQ